MDLKTAIEAKISLKKKELSDLEAKARMAQTYIRALEDALALSRNDVVATTSGGKSSGGPRVGSDVARARDAIRDNGNPMHISEILVALGKPDDKKARLSLVSTIASYVRKGEVFTRTGPNVFGLAEIQEHSAMPATPEPPEDFGIPAGDEDTIPG